ncbi:SDR family NAD(P)-dependent oxidoreductase [Nucisporomicrobium flavum]|uniref:SDR family NAD(P)-dependent oxidoreductase n=1 Tax=Nucisporomicrobium flavum TaxID=2785915 RepID=UPI003C30B918
MDTMRHHGRVVLITGAGSGIGRAAAIRFAGEGARVVATDVDGTALDGTLKQLADAGHDARGVRADLTDPAGIAQILAEAGGRVDVLVNNAGVMDHFLPLTELDDATWEHLLAVNLTAVMRLCRATLPAMREAGSGAIVNVASIGGLTGWVAGTAYVTSKHAVIGLTRSIAALYADDGIRCNAVCPGGVETNIGVTAAPAVGWAFERLGRSFGRSRTPAQPDEIAALVSWLASAEAGNVNGAVITADGGFMA